MVEAPRYTMRDCMYALYVDLAEAARTIPLYDADARERWFDAAVWLLCQVPDLSQRCSWAHSLALSFNQAGCPLALVVGELWRRAEEKGTV